MSNIHENYHWLAAGTPWFAQSLQCAELDNLAMHHITAELACARLERNQ